MNDASPDPRLPVPNEPGGYLPRIAYKPPVGDEQTTDKSELSKSKAKPNSKTASREKPAPNSSEDAPRTVLKEATPELDTYEVRRKIRMIVGIVIVAVVVLIATILVAIAMHSDTPPSIEETDIASSGPDPASEFARRENAAKELLAESRLYARKGQDEQATQRLKRLLDSYGNSQASKEARAALDRQAQQLPLFPDRPIVSANPKADTKAETGNESQTTVIDAGKKPLDLPANTTQPQTSIVTVKPPDVEPEAYRETALPRPRGETAAKTLPAGFRPRDEAGLDPSGWPNEITTDHDGSPMELIPAGEFVMGSRQGRPAERPEHQVMLATYYVDQHEVTERQFNRFLSAMGKESRVLTDDADRPVTQVTLEEAVAYAQWVGKSLPTEAQWEKAARATDGRTYPWGNAKPDWDPPRLPRQIDPVCSYRRDLSPYAVFDMSGNAWEWTSDWFEARAYQGLRGTLTDPTGPTKPGGRIPEVTVRGGSSEWDVAWRSGMRTDARLPYLGFRCVLGVEQTRPSQQPAPPQQKRGQPARGQGNVIPF